MEEQKVNSKTRSLMECPTLKSSLKSERKKLKNLQKEDNEKNLKQALSLKDVGLLPQEDKIRNCEKVIFEDEIKENPLDIMEEAYKEEEPYLKEESYLKEEQEEVEEKLQEGNSKIPFQVIPNKILVSSAKKVNGLINKKEKTVVKKKKVQLKEGSTQELIPLKEISYGLCKTTDGRYIKFLEIVPSLHFFEQNQEEQDSIANAFRDLFKVCPDKTKIHILSDTFNPLRLIHNIKTKNVEEKNPLVLKRMKEHCDLLYKISSKEAMTKRYFIEYEYRGDRNGKRSNNIEDIVNTMNSYAYQIQDTLAASGNAVAVGEELNYSQGEILYYFYNRKTSKEESIDERVARLNVDARAFNTSSGTNRNLLDVDCIAPKGFKIYNPNYFLMDGTYYTYLSIKSNDFPSYAYPGWLNLIPTWDKVDLTINIQRQPRELTKNALGQYTKHKRVLERGRASKEGDSEKVIKGTRKLNNTQYVLGKMNDADEDLFNVTVSCTIRGDSPKDLVFYKEKIIDTLAKKSIYVEDSFLECEEYFNYTMPFMIHSNSIYGRCKRNFLTSSLKSLYPFTSSELVDNDGILMGTQVATGGLAYLNIFNTIRFSNANVLIVGSSGSGKTYLEQILGYRFRFTGVRVFYILPVKGQLEYSEGCREIDGSFISLAPSSKDCLNIMEIRAEVKTSIISEESAAYEKLPLVSKKIISLITFINLLLGEDVLSKQEESVLQIEIVKLYEDFGIYSDDNDSIFQDKEKRILKQMPFISHLKEKITGIPLLERVVIELEPFVTGIWRNMNGPTNVDLENNYTIFNVDESMIGKAYTPAILYIAYDCVLSLMKASRITFDVLFLDEVWKMMINKYCAEQVYEMTKLIRGYAGALILATQEIEDFARCAGGYGISVISNTETKILLKMKDNDRKMMEKYLDMDPQMKVSLKALKKTYGILVLEKEWINIHISSSKEEEAIFTTDPNIRRKIELEKMNDEVLNR